MGNIRFLVGNIDNPVLQHYPVVHKEGWKYTQSNPVKNPSKIAGIIKRCCRCFKVCNTIPNKYSY